MDPRGLRGAISIAIAVSAMAGWSGSAAGSGFQLQEQNASGLGNAYSGQAAAGEDASTIYWNPAGMTRLSGRQAVGSLELVKPSGRFSNSSSCLPYLGTGVGTTTCPFGQNGNLGHGVNGTGSGGDSGDWAAIPNTYVSWQLNPQLWLGLGIGVPFGLTTEWDSNWIGRFHAIKSAVETININPSLAWKVNEMFSVGVGFNAMRLEAELTNAVSYRAVALASGVGPIIAGTPAGSEGVAKVEGDDWGYGWNLGVMINFSPATRLGLHYRSKTDFKIKGDVSFDNLPAALGAVAQVGNSDVTADIKLPDTFSIGLAHSFTPRWQVLADWTWTGWDSIQDLVIVRSSGTLSGSTLTTTALRFKNSWRAGVGVNHQLTDAWKLRFGVAYDKTPVQDEFRTPRLPDEDRTWLSIGAQWTLSKQWAFDFGYSYIFVRDGSSALVNQETATSAPRGSLVGNYKADTNILGVQARFSF